MELEKMFQTPMDYASLIRRHVPFRLKDALLDHEEYLLQIAIDEFGGDLEKIAEYLGLKVPSLRYRLMRLGFPLREKSARHKLMLFKRATKM